MAGVELATAYYSLVPSMAGTAAAVRAQSGSLLPVWGGIGDDAGKGVKGGLIGGIAGSAAGIAAAIATLGIGNLIGDAVRAGTDFAMSGVDFAGDLSETRSAIDQTFGAEAAAIIDKWSAQGAAALGTTQLAALQAAQTFGVFGRAAGLSGGDLASFSADLTGLATDMASFSNTSPEQAIDAIGAALRGESEPIRQYGVLLDEATLKARAMAMGIDDGVGPLTQQQRVLAAQAEIFAQTSLAQGDFERTSGSLANQQKILAANVEDTQAKLGMALLPAMTSLVTLANTALVPALVQLVDTVGPILGDALMQAGPAFIELMTAMAPLIPELVELGAAVLPPLIDGLIAISPLIIAWTDAEASLREGLSLLFGLLSGDLSMEEFITSVDGMGGAFIDTLRDIGTFVGEGIADITRFGISVGDTVGDVITWFTDLPGQIMTALSDAGSWLFGVGEDMIAGLISGIDSMVQGVIDSVGDVVNGAVDWAKNLLGIHSPSKVFEGIGINTALGYKQGVERIEPKIHRSVYAMVTPPRVEAQDTSTLDQASNMAVLQLLREIRDRVGITVPVFPIQGAMGSANVNNTVRGA